MSNMSQINIGAGKTLYWQQMADQLHWRQIGKHNRTTLPVQTCQRYMYNTHPYTWYAAVASETNNTNNNSVVTDVVEALAANLGMTQTRGVGEKSAITTSYKVVIKRSRDQLDCELDANFKCTLLRAPWDRFLVSHVLSGAADKPDLRYVVRTRHPPKKRLADLYMNTQIIDHQAKEKGGESVASVLSPSLGEVSYCCKRVIRKWGVSLGGGVTLQLVETKRTPLIGSRKGDEYGIVRTEYELVADIPNKGEADLADFSNEMWSYGNEFAGVLERGFQGLQAHITRL